MNNKNFLIDSTIVLAGVTGYLYLLGLMLKEVGLNYVNIPISIFNFSTESLIVNSVREIISSFFSIGFFLWIFTIVLMVFVYNERVFFTKILSLLIFIIGSFFSVSVPYLQKYSDSLYAVHDCLNKDICDKNDVKNIIKFMENGKVNTLEGFYNVTKKDFIIIFSKDTIKVINKSAFISSEVSFEEVLDGVDKTN